MVRTRFLHRASNTPMMNGHCAILRTPLIEPPYDRQQWYSVAGEYGLYRADSTDHRLYYDRLRATWHRSPSSRTQ